MREAWNREKRTPSLLPPLNVWQLHDVLNKNWKKKKKTPENTHRKILVHQNKEEPGTGEANQTNCNGPWLRHIEAEPQADKPHLWRD